MRDLIQQLCDRVLSGGRLSVDEGTALLEGVGRDELMDLLAAADRIRRRFVGDEVHLCSIVNAKSGRCTEDCGFCAQSIRFQTGVQEYGLLDERAVEQAAEKAAANGAEALGLVAAWRGLRQGPEFERVKTLIRKVSAGGKVHADASLGLIDDPQVAAELKRAGLHTYNHNLETAASHFDNVCKTHSHADRLRTLKLVREAGMHLCSGGILGMGETPRQRVELAAELAEVDPDIVPLNFLNPIEGTPAGGSFEPLAPLEALKCIAVFRFMLPRHHIMVAGGREVVLGKLAPLMYLAGASATMVGDYLTTPGASPAEDHAVIAALELQPRPTEVRAATPRPQLAADMTGGSIGTPDARHKAAAAVSAAPAAAVGGNASAAASAAQGLAHGRA